MAGFFPCPTLDLKFSAALFTHHTRAILLDEKTSRAATTYPKVYAHLSSGDETYTIANARINHRVDGRFE
jgi:hypothetical protein